MQDLMLRAYKASNWMEPIALLDYYVKIINYQTSVFRKVTFLESIPPFQCLDIGAVAAQTRGAKTPATNLDLFDGEFGQFRWFPLDNAQISIYLPTGVAKWQLKNMTVGLDRSIIYRDPSLVSTEFNTWEDERPSFEPVNFTDYALTACRIIAMGYRFITDPVTDPGLLSRLNAGTQAYTPIICAGRTGGGK
jgi:hypothetical protein